MTEASRKWWIVTGTALAGLLVCLDFTIVNLSLTAIQKEFASSVNQLQWVMTGFGIGFCAFLVAMGRLADIKGHRKLLYIGIVSFGLFSLGAGLSSSLTELVVFRILQGIAGATLFPCGMSLTAAAFPKDEQGRALGIYNSVLGIGMALGPLVGGFIVTYLGWRWNFLLNIPVVMLSLGICLYAIDGHDTKSTHSIDWLGITLLAAALTCIVFSVSQGPTYGWHSPVIVGVLLTGVLFIMILAFVEFRVSEPLIPPSLFRKRSFLTASLIYISTVGFPWAMMFIVPLFLHQYYDYPSYQVGLLLVPMTLMTVLAPSFAGKLLDRRGVMICIVLICVLLLPAYVLQLLTTNLFVILFALTLFGITWGIGNGISVPIALSGFEDLKDSGLVSGAAIMLLNVGGVVILSITATVLHLYQTNALAQNLEPREAILAGYQASITTMLGIAIVLLCITLWSARKRS